MITVPTLHRHERPAKSNFADSTGLSDTSREPRRYLWTDAFAVCNYLELNRQTGEQSFLQLALKLVDQVHRTLGRHRKDSVRSGWLSGLLESLMHAIEQSLQAFATHNQPNLPAEYRLAFRELGLAIGLHTIGRMQKRIAQHPEHFGNANQLTPLLTNLSPFHRIHVFIENFWLETDHRSVNPWQEHADINNVMSERDGRCHTLSQLFPALA